MNGNDQKNKMYVKLILVSLIVFLSAYFLFYQVDKRPSKQRASRPHLTIAFGASSVEQKREFEKKIQAMQKKLSDNGIDTSIVYRIPDEGSLDKAGMDADIAMVYTMTALLQIRESKGNEILAWKTNCSANVQLLIRQDSAINSPQDLTNKKVVLFHVGALGPLLLSAPDDLGIGQADLYQSRSKEQVIEALQKGAVDAVVTEIFNLDTAEAQDVRTSSLLGRQSAESVGLKQLLTTKDEAPCRLLVGSKNADPRLIERFLEINEIKPASSLPEATESIMNGFVRIDKEALQKLMQRFDWQKLKQRQKELKVLL